VQPTGTTLAQVWDTCDHVVTLHKEMPGRSTGPAGRRTDGDPGENGLNLI